MDKLKLLGASAKADYYDPETWEVFLREGDVIDQASADRLAVLGLAGVEAKLHPEDEVEARDEVKIRVEGEGDETASAQSVQRWIGWGLKENAVARVLLIKPGTGVMRVNGKPAMEYFGKTPRKGQEFVQRLLGMREVRDQLAEMDAVAHVRGSCETCLQQAHAVAHGLAHALEAHDRELRESLGKAGYGGRKVGRGMRFGDEETR